MRLPAARVYVGLLGIESGASMLAFTVTNLYYVNELGMSPFALVLCGTAMELAIVLFEVPTGVVADRISRRASVVLSYAVIGTAMLGFAAFASVPLVIACYALWGLGYTFQSGALDAWLADEIGPDRLSRVVLRGAQVGWAGALGGVVVATLLGAVSLRGAIVAGGVTMLGVAVALALVMPETGFRPHATPEVGGLRALLATAVEGAAVVRGHHVLLLLVGVGFVYGAWTESFDRLWVAQIVEIGVPSGLRDVTAVGILTGLAVVSGIVVLEVATRRLEDPSDARLRRILTIVTGGLLVGALVFALAGSFALALVAYLVLVALRSLVAPLQTVWVNRSIEDSSTRATVLSMVNQSDALGQVAGGPAIGGVASAVSLRAGLGLGAVALVPAVALYRFGGRARRG